jgi:glyoxylase-like metal-dependent hydrolase (beta-lactamase superfamily II)
MSAALSYDVFVSPPVEQQGAEPDPTGERRAWSPIASTLITAGRDAVLVDPPITTTQGRSLAQWVDQSGKTLRAIYITHGHADHWFSTPQLLKTNPGVPVYATPNTIEVMRQHALLREKVWDAYFPGQIPDVPVVAVPSPAEGIDLGGEPLIPIELGHTDTDHTTVLHVPSIGLVVAGDVVYNNVHPYLAETPDGGLEAWLSALDRVAALDPRFVVAGHKDQNRDDAPGNIDHTRAYLLDARRLLAGNPSAVEFFDAMMKLHPTRLNPGMLWFGATMLLRSPATA